MGRLGEKIKNWWSRDDYALTEIVIIVLVLVAILLGVLIDDNPCKGDESACDCQTIYVKNRNPMDVCIVKK